MSLGMLNFSQLHRQILVHSWTEKKKSQGFVSAKDHSSYSAATLLLALSPLISRGHCVSSLGRGRFSDSF
jgi:hypothetical protein